MYFFTTKTGEFTLKDNVFDLRVSESDDKSPVETPASSSCFPSFKSPFSPKDTISSIDEGGTKPSDQSAISGSTLGVDIDDEASLLDVSKRSFLGDKSRQKEDLMVEHAKIEQRRELTCHRTKLLAISSSF